MTTTSPNLGFTLFSLGSNVNTWGGIRNDDLTLIDALIGGTQDWTYNTAFTGSPVFSGTPLLSGNPSFSGDPAFLGNPDFSAILNKATVRTDLELGTGAQQDVQTSDTDNTADRLLRVGAFGLGKTTDAPLIADLDATDLPNGFYRTDNTTLNRGNLPNSVNHILITRAEFVSAQRQMAIQNNNNDIYVRWLSSSAGPLVWQPWVKLLSWEDILGSVVQVSGEPQGAVIERGGVGDNHYVRFADGTQICMINGVPADFTQNNRIGYFWNFAAEFAETSSLVGFIARSSSNLDYFDCSPTDLGAPFQGALNTTGMTLGWYGAGSSPFVGSSSVFDCRLIAFGRWFT